MLHFDYDPPVTDKKTAGSFVQTIRLMDGETVVGVAKWLAPADIANTVQLLQLEIALPYRRSGHGRRLMRAVTDQACLRLATKRCGLKRIWVGVGHKSQVVGRSFLTGEGFHHVGSSGGLLGDQDLLIYVKAMR